MLEEHSAFYSLPGSKINAQDLLHNSSYVEEEIPKDLSDTTNQSSLSSASGRCAARTLFLQQPTKTATVRHKQIRLLIQEVKRDKKQKSGLHT